jgi:hypothetical protein
VLSPKDTLGRLIRQYEVLQKQDTDFNMCVAYCYSRLCEYNIYLGVQQIHKMSFSTNIPITIIDNAIVIMLYHIHSMLFLLQNEITNLAKLLLAVGLVRMLL